jgi:hypothetical protein
MPRGTTLPIPTLGRDFCIYLAGLLDGEGCFRIGRSVKHSGQSHYCYTAEVKVVLTHEGVIARVAEELHRPYSHHASKNDKWQDTYRVAIHDCEGIVSFVEQVLPFLIVKQEAAQQVLDFCRSRIARNSTQYNPSYSQDEMGMFEVTRTLNLRGTARVAAVRGYNN